MASVRIHYRLPVSVVRITGQTYTVVDRTKPPSEQRSVESELAARLLVVGDPDGARALELDDSDLTDTAAAVRFTPDGRILSIDASSAGQGAALVKAGASVGGALLGAVLAFHNPLAATAAAVAGRAAVHLGAGGGGAGPAGVTAAAKAAAGPRVTDDDVARELGRLVAAYVQRHPREADVLATYRAAIGSLVRAHAGAAAAQDLPRVKELTKLLRLTRQQAAPVEDHYHGWLARQVVRTAAEAVERDFVVDELPTEAALRERLDTRGVEEVAAYSKDEVRRELLDAGTAALPWAVFGRDHGMAVSVDYLDTPPPATVAGGPDALTIAYRQARWARVRTWLVEMVEAATSTGPDGQPVPTPRHYRVRLARTEQRMVVSRQVGDRPNEVALGLPRGAFRKGSLSVTFDEHGSLVAFGTQRSAAAAAAAGAVAEVPGALQGALATGAKVADGLVAGSAELAELERKLAIAKKQREVDGLTATRPPPPPATELQRLAAEVEEAELRARLARAAAVQADPDAGVVVVRID